VRMPGGGGPKAARGIRRRSPQTRVVALSAYGDDSEYPSRLTGIRAQLTRKPRPVRSSTVRRRLILLKKDHLFSAFLRDRRVEIPNRAYDRANLRSLGRGPHPCPQAQPRRVPNR
jgi:hypothetical protein